MDDRIYLSKKKGSGDIQYYLKKISELSGCNLSISVAPGENSRLYVQNSDGISAPLFLPFGGAISGEFLVDGEYEVVSMELLSRIVRNVLGQFVFVDIGANIGLISRQVAKLNPAEIYCYEANPSVFSYLKRNMDLSTPVIHLNNEAVWKSSEEKEFIDTVDIDGYGSLNHEYFQKSLRLKKDLIHFTKTTLDISEECSKWKQKNLPIVYKSDIQGADLDLLLHIKNEKLFHISCGLIEISNNEFGLLFGELMEFFTKTHRSVVIAPDGIIYKMTEHSKIENIIEKNYNYVDIFFIRDFENSGWYHSRPIL
ncbi:FkbM family methyltransferase [Thalassobaculum sp. OXR-137]|uniref:FkbM family methyltransferase n=1 Tax=Thalassobaculum sp. OXR-137 TaxID=3100173 RepID=UPI002AC943DB|nr:FkbM family methyltransferase [Thalassobaculum sp. OXR-137]WPZ36772.1 FkbM family methyltransferase [Thalassobaculum sp. OXR-137]